MTQALVIIVFAGLVVSVLAASRHRDGHTKLRDKMAELLNDQQLADNFVDRTQKFDADLAVYKRVVELLNSNSEAHEDSGFNSTHDWEWSEMITMLETLLLGNPHMHDHLKDQPELDNTHKKSFPLTPKYISPISNMNKLTSSKEKPLGSIVEDWWRKIVEFVLDEKPKAQFQKNNLTSRDSDCKGATCQFRYSCGKADLNTLTPSKHRLIDGVVQSYGDWPQFVRLQITISFGIESSCGGVLVSDRHVLTAAHCLRQDNKNELRVILGDHSRSEEDGYEEYRKASFVCMSSMFGREHGDLVYDYAVLLLDRPVEFSNHIQPACLPYDSVAYHKSRCYVLGMGAEAFDFGEPKMSDSVRQMEVRQIGCYDYGLDYKDRSRHCFAPRHGVGNSCIGDSGGPVLCSNGPLYEPRWTVVGLVSYGVNYCDLASHSTVYTNVIDLLYTMKKDCGL